ncbi:MAG: VOC family protein [Acidimicrobiia bacterium]|nr:VOC family protein [Acidimicrobiia bacterium]MDH5505402.1 VOC family protein [Acidimicrobiia bacterium]
MDWKLELIVVPSADVDRSKSFYIDHLNFDLTVDYENKGFRVVQLVPPGSACAIALMPNPEAAGTLQGLHLVVPNIGAARSELIGRDTEVSELFHYVEGRQHPGPDPDHTDYATFFTFNDPDGNGWLVQEVGWTPLKDQ